MKPRNQTGTVGRRGRRGPLRLQRRAAAGAIVSTCLGLVGCSNGSPREEHAVDALVHQWIAAERNADGRTWCRLLARKHLADEEANARSFSPPLTCIELHSRHPRGLTATLRSQLKRAQHEATNGFRIEETIVDGDRASVQISWLAPTGANPILSTAGNTQRGDRLFTTFQLVRQGGSWKIGRE
jgi:hypothetical protein